jgi:hypothetical protein
LTTHEKVCALCGEVAQLEARFCQNGHALVRKCTKCLSEFAIDHQRCDACGWPQGVKPDTAEGRVLAFDRAVSDLGDPSYTVVENALNVIIAGGGTASSAAATAAAAAIHSLVTDPSFRLAHRSTGDNVESYWRALAALGPAARQSLPAIGQRMEEIWGSFFDRCEMMRCIGAISPEDALAYCNRSLEEEGKWGSCERINRIVQIAFALGKAAIPTLKKFRQIGLVLGGPRGDSCTAAISALRNGQHTVTLHHW